MITRYFGGLPFATVAVEGSEIECIIDTGFDGALALPAADVHRLHLPRLMSSDIVLADGSQMETTMHLGHVQWLGSIVPVQVLSMELGLGLIGMRLLSSATTVMTPSKGVLRIRAA